MKLDSVIMKINRNRWKTLSILIVCIVLGLLMGIVLFGEDLERVSDPNSWHVFAFFLAVTGAGILAWCLLPKTLSHVAEESPEFPGTKGTLVCGLVVIFCGFSYLAVPAALVAFVSIASRRSVQWSGLAVLSLWGNLAFFELIFPAPGSGIWGWDMVATVGFLTVSLLLWGGWRGHQRNQRDALRRQAIHNERDRIARDMHDSLSHRLSLISVHAGALGYREQMSADQYQDAAETIRCEAKAAVDELRLVLDSLDNSVPLSIDELVRSARDAGQDVVFHSTGDMLNSAMSRQTLARAVQEGLTNARKHAPEQRVTIHLAGRNLEISNPVPKNVVRKSSKSAGKGLEGLRARVALNGGEMTVVTGDPFIVRVTVPEHTHG